MPGTYVIAAIGLFAASLWSATSSHAGGVFLDVPMTRVFTCKSVDATMEIYVPQSLMSRRDIEKTRHQQDIERGTMSIDVNQSGEGTRADRNDRDA